MTQELERRIMKLEFDSASLATATRENTTAIKSLTDMIGTLDRTLSTNKAVLIASLRFAAIGTTIIGGVAAFFMWLLGALHR